MTKMSAVGVRGALAIDAQQRSLPTAAGVALVVGVFLLQLVRVRGVPVWDSIFIEDANYVQDANRLDAHVTLLRGYAGYLQLVPRLVAAPTALLPVVTLAAYLAVTSAALTAAAGAFVYRATRDWIASVPVRLAVASMACVAPAMLVENTATLTNTIWLALMVTPWALLATGTTRRDVTWRSLAVLLSATSTVLTVLFVPLAILCLLRRRWRRSEGVVSGALLVGLAVQALVVRSSVVAPGKPNEVRELVDFFGVRVLGSLLVGERPLDQLWLGLGEIIVVAFVIATVGILSFTLWRAGSRNQRAAVVFIGYSVLAYVVPAWARGTTVFGFGLDRYTQNMSRYTLGPILYLVSAVALAVDGVGPERRRRTAAIGRRVLVIQTLIVVLVGLFGLTARSPGPSWQAELDRAALQCRDASPDSTVRIATSPGAPSAFSTELTCGRIRG